MSHEHSKQPLNSWMEKGLFDSSIIRMTSPIQWWFIPSVSPSSSSSSRSLSLWSLPFFPLFSFITRSTLSHRCSLYCTMAHWGTFVVLIFWNYSQNSFTKLLISNPVITGRRSADNSGYSSSSIRDKDSIGPSKGYCSRWKVSQQE